MRDKEPTSLKAISQTTRPYPSTPRPSSQTPRAGPRYFPQNVLPDDDSMEQPPNLLPDSPPSPTSPPNTPTPIYREISGPTQPPDLLVFREFNVTTTTPQETTATEVKNSDLHNSMHAPGNAMVDQIMGAPHSPPTIREQTEEEDAILAHLALAEANRSVLSQNGINHCTILPQFTPTPIGGFPKIHMAHSAQIFDHLNNKVLLAWFQVEHPKFMVQVFDQSGKDVAEKTAIIAEHIRASISIISDFVHQEAPPIRVSPPHPQGGRGAKELPIGFLVHKISEEAKNLIIDQRIWSSTDITFEALPFNCATPPELLFCLSGFTTPDADIVRKTVIDIWAYDDNRCHIDDTFSMCGFPDDELVYKATHDLIHSVRVEILDFKVTGGLSVPRFNIFTTSPTNNAKTWTEL
ncbi:uncharacterized protein EDB91DRAFT_1086840 [Suillus paluster]|uniref:uncharacterized protein n=1 Tax=Suillus paluster TaxID=48578 RepID=UPI001B86C123|nr:uncharacterized protein EDB91DRAFT_1086840 [Suillus paluster]KAG1726278.1 hypothetical protein EDB91DRAFT_1086840 [Suillus paluster]